MPEAVLHLPGTLYSHEGVWAQVEEDQDEMVFEDEELEDDDWDLDDDELDELEFDENGDDWDDDVDEALETYVADEEDEETW